MSNLVYKTNKDLMIRRTYKSLTNKYKAEIASLKHDLNTFCGCLFISNYELPNRYNQWTMGFKNPILVLEGTGNNFIIKGHNKGVLLLDLIWTTIKSESYLKNITFQSNTIYGTIKESPEIFNETERLRKPSLISLVRSLQDIFFYKQESFLGLYGAFGYDLIFGFEDIMKIKIRESTQRDLVLYLPDELIVIDHLQQISGIYQYEFSYQENSSENQIESCLSPYIPSHCLQVDSRELDKGEYAKQVEKLKPYFKRGDMFECVLSQTQYLTTRKMPSTLFNEVLTKNPAPYSFLINLGKSEFLVGASPEMFVRVTDKRIETCPISGTISRGKNAIEESENMLKLLNSEKECSELIMCTDIDRSDKSRISIPGTVKVISHREIEKTSRLLHTVDHVEGYLKPEHDGLDALCVHLWAVTVTGSPKKMAVEYIEKHESSPRKWYGGAVGIVHFNGNINTGLTLRTLHLQNGIVNLRTGATLLYDSVPELEELETELKASALEDIVKNNDNDKDKLLQDTIIKKKALSLLVIDFNDSFVHTISSYLNELVETVDTVRYYNLKNTDTITNYDGYILSPGPKHPRDYPMKWLLDTLISYQKPILGICLGYQAIIEYYGGTLDTLPEPIHGKASKINVLNDECLFKNCSGNMIVGRYHSIMVYSNTIPETLTITSELTLVNKQQIAMSIRHHELPIYGIQFHPESILTTNKIGYSLLSNFINYCETL